MLLRCSCIAALLGSNVSVTKKPKLPKLTLIKIRGKWWIDHGDHEDGPHGPYATRGEADEDRKGLNRYYRHCDEPGYICIGK